MAGRRLAGAAAISGHCLDRGDAGSLDPVADPQADRSGNARAGLCLGAGLVGRPPDHSTLSRTRRLIDLETHAQVFAWVLGLLADRGLLEGKRIGIDATTL